MLKNTCAETGIYYNSSAFEQSSKILQRKNKNIFNPACMYVPWPIETAMGAMIRTSCLCHLLSPCADKRRLCMFQARPSEWPDRHQNEARKSAGTQNDGCLDSQKRPQRRILQSIQIHPTELERPHAGRIGESESNFITTSSNLIIHWHSGVTSLQKCEIQRGVCKIVYVQHSSVKSIQYSISFYDVPRKLLFVILLRGCLAGWFPINLPQIHLFHPPCA